MPGFYRYHYHMDILFAYGELLQEMQWKGIDLVYRGRIRGYGILTAKGRDIADIFLLALVAVVACTANAMTASKF